MKLGVLTNNCLPLEFVANLYDLGFYKAGQTSLAKMVRKFRRSTDRALVDILLGLGNICK
jgi:hypothetical protein